MKAYVIVYGPRQEDSRQIEVVYGADPNPELRYESRHLAEAACRKLNHFGVRVGAHHCAFAVDHLPGDDFGVFCVCHPHWIAAHSSFFPNTTNPEKDKPQKGPAVIADRPHSPETAITAGAQ